MNPNARRQIRDIQVRAERLIDGTPTMDDIEEFDQYNEELRKYLLNNMTDPELLERVRQIPKILEESNSQLATRGILATFFTMFAPGVVSYFQDRQRIENTKESIREARGAYATVEFLSKNAEW
jgi:hypothetical protein